MNIGTIQGGTHAGWRVVRERGEDWACPVCHKKHRYFWLRCPNDGTPRPD